ncbi:MAG: SAM-dependent methyltransferase, partial [Candidatus Bathyarchaeia archaeon]
LLRTFLKSPFINEVEVDIVPGISSVQVCAARLRLCWDNIDLISFHEGVIPEKKEQLAELIKKGKTVFVLPDPKTFTPRDIVMFLIKSGIDKATQVAICENLTLSNERIIQTTLGEAAKIDTSSLSVMVIKAKLEE